MATTLWYADTDAPGGGVGSIISPWTVAEAIAADNGGTVQPDDIVYVKGSSELSLGAQTLTQAGTNHHWISWIGYSVTPGDNGLVSLKYNGDAEGWMFTLPSVPYREFQNFRFDGDNIADRALSTNNIFNCRNCWFGNLGDYAGYRYGMFMNCEFKDVFGIGQRGHVINCKVDTATGTAIQTGDVAVNCIFKDCQTGSTYALDVSNCIFDGGTNVQAYIQSGGCLKNCIFVNAASGKEAVYFGDAGVDPRESYVTNVNFYNCDTKSNALDKIFEYTELDPEFVDAANFDYRIKNTALRGAGLSNIGLLTETTDYEVTPGPDQVAITSPTTAQVEKDVSFGYDADPSTGELVSGRRTRARYQGV